MDGHRIRSFAEFWPYYVGEHRHPVCRGLHYLGTSLALAVVVALVTVGDPWLVVLGLAVGYGPAWIAHFFVEHNRPATFKYPLWSLFSDFKMLGLAIRGRMAAEVTRLYGSPAPGPDSPRLMDR
jgi:hypothetical protein